MSTRLPIVAAVLASAIASVTWGQTVPDTAPATAPAIAAMPVQIHIDAGKSLDKWSPAWRFFGYDEPNYTYTKDGKKLLGQIGELGKSQVYIRCHNLLCTGDGTGTLKWGSTNAYTEDAQGKPIYDWTIVDRIFDSYLERGLKPYAQIGFMPKALSTKPDPYEYKFVMNGKSTGEGWSQPPKDYQKWSDLCYEWTKHSVEKYGKAEVDQWYWELWNEPNIFYWKGTPEEYAKLYDYTVAGVRRALPSARVGGPETTSPRGGSAAKFLRGFLDHCVNGTNAVTGEKGTPIDFISFHAKGAPKFVNGHVEMGIAEQLKDIDTGFGIVASFPTLKNKPIVIGESDPEGLAALPATKAKQNGYRRTSLYASYTAASFARKWDLAAKHGVNFEGAVTWSFEFENQPYFEGFRVLATNGITLPVFNTFRMFGKMGGERVAVDSDAAAALNDMVNKGVRGKADVSALATLADHKLAVMVWNYHDDDVAGPAAQIDMTIDGLSKAGSKATVTHYRIDEEHSNSYSAWQKMGSPQQPTPEQYQELEKAAKLETLSAPESVSVDAGKASMKITLPRQAVELVVLEW